MQAVIFLLDAVVSFFCTLFLLRFIMQAMRISFAGQLGNFVVALTNWAVKPLRRIIPGFRGLDWSSVLVAFGLQLLFAGIMVSLSMGDADGLLPMLLWYAVRGVLRNVVYIFIAALIFQAVLSWVNPYSPFAAPVQQLTRPMLDPLRRFIPLISGIDLSPLVAILVLQVLLMLL
jgi:YggT family protein